jgi:putative tryptophan/tyrosine transport system substrate-binding protein
MRRREFIALVGGAAAAWPLAARAQQSRKIWRIGMLSTVSRNTVLYDGFLQGMRELGYVEGKNFIVEFRTTEGRYDRLPELASELVGLNVDVIVTGVVAAIPLLQRATTTIPIVMAYSTDPVGNGFVASLARPGGNTTGLAGSSDDTTPKQIELLATVVPNATRIGLLGNPETSTYAPVLKNARDAARKARLDLMPVEARTPQQIEDAFASFRDKSVQAIMVAGDAIYFGQRQLIAELASRGRLASIFIQREYVEAGGLMSYGESLSDFFRRSATFVDKILKGDKPGELPVEQPTRFFLVVNLKTAKTINLKIPDELLAIADEVIE